jgi:hypothetical protein
VPRPAPPLRPRPRGGRAGEVGGRGGGGAVCARENGPGSNTFRGGSSAAADREGGREDKKSADGSQLVRVICHFITRKIGFLCNKF